MFLFYNGAKPFICHSSSGKTAQNTTLHFMIKIELCACAQPLKWITQFAATWHFRYIVSNALGDCNNHSQMIIASTFYEHHPFYFVTLKWQFLHWIFLIALFFYSFKSWIRHLNGTKQQPLNCSTVHRELFNVNGIPFQTIDAIYMFFDRMLFDRISALQNGIVLNV